MLGASKSILAIMTRYGLLICLLITCLSTNVKTDHASNVYSPMEAYWYSNLPNTSMPEIIHNLIHSGQKEKFGWIEYTVTWSKGRIPNHILNLFFLPKDIYPGANINEKINLERSIVGNAFIPRTEAEAMPFLSKNLSQFLNHYSIEPGTKEAKQIQKSLSHCEALDPNTGAKQFCATSLESMIDNTISEFGTENLKVMSTVLGKRQSRTTKIFYKVGSPVVELPQQKFVLCHPVVSPQAVFYCHTKSKFKGYVIPLEGNNGSKVNALAICHYDAKDFNPVFFEMINVKPSTMPICHFLMEDHFVWAPL